MNFIAIIGIIDELKKLNEKTSEVIVKVEKPFYHDNEIWYDVLTVVVNNEIFSQQLKQMSTGMIIGIKGRMENLDHQNKIVCERVQLF